MKYVYNITLFIVPIVASIITKNNMLLWTLIASVFFLLLDVADKNERRNNKNDCRNSKKESK